MSPVRNTNLVFKTLVIGALIAALVYFFHPDVGQFSLIINGEPVADPLTRFAAIPTLLIILLCTGIIVVLAILGVGFFLFVAVLAFVMLGVLMIAPYFWPELLIIFLIILFMSIGDTKENNN